MRRDYLKRIFIHPIFVVTILFIIPLVTMILLLSDSPLFSLISFFAGPVRSNYSIGNMLNSSAPLILTSLGAFIALRANAFNLGGEGQVYLGMTFTGIVSSIIPGVPVILIIFLAGILPALMTYISGYLETRFKINSLISTYLISMIIIKLCNYLISGPFLRVGSNILETEIISVNHKLSKIVPPSNLSTGIIISITMVIIIGIILKTTKWGVKFTLSGSNSDFSDLMSINSKGYKVAGLSISGFLHGIAGGILVCGELHTAIIDSYAGLGWDGLSSGLLAGGNPFYVVITSLFYSYIDSGAHYVNLVSDITLEISIIIKSLIFFVISSKLLKNHFIKRGRI